MEAKETSSSLGKLKAQIHHVTAQLWASLKLPDNVTYQSNLKLHKVAFAYQDLSEYFCTKGPMLRIDSIEIDKLSIECERELTAASYSFSSFQSCIVRMRTNSGLTGWGEAAPSIEFGGYDASDSAKVLAAFKPERSDCFLDDPEAFFDRVLADIVCPSARCALDCAAHDLYARSRGVPVYQIYRATPRHVPSSITVHLNEDPELTAEEISAILDSYPSVRILKVKLKGEDDLDRCRAVRRVTPAHLGFILDANQGFKSPDDGIRTLNEAIQILGNVVVIEEPCAIGDLETMRRVHHQVKRALVFAHESCADPQALMEIIDSKCAHGVNLTIQNLGGITPFRRVAQKAHAAGLKVMLGCLNELSLGNQASAHAVACTDNVTVCDLDSDLLHPLPNIFHGVAPFSDGCRLPSEGLGFSFGYRQPQFRQACQDHTLQFENIARISIS